MIRNTHTRLLRLLLLLTLLTVITSLLAQDAPPETPTEAPPVLTTEAVTDVPTDAPPVVATDIPTEAPTALPTAEVTTVVIPTETATDSSAPTQAVTNAVTAVPTGILDPFGSEPPLTLVLRDLFEEAVLPSHWTMPAGWLLTSVADGKAIQISTTSAGSKAALSDVYADVAVMGYFTFTDQTGAAQLIAHESTNGAYVASLDASGLVTLAKHDSTGAAAVLGTASVPASAAAHSLRLSVIGNVLRVAVDDMLVIAVQDAAPLPAGMISVQAVFPGATGTILFDNFFLWTPTQAETATPLAPTQLPLTAAPSETLTPTTPSVAANGGLPAPSAALPTAGLTAPVLTAPALNGVVATLKPTFSWGAVAGANRYHVIVATNFSCTTPVSGAFDVVVATLSFIPTVALDQGEYWFCVESQNITNGTASGFIGEKRHFVVNLSLTPADNAVIVAAAGASTAPLSFTWTNIVGATQGIQIASDSSMSVLLTDTTTPSAAYAFGPQPFGIYYWRVRINGSFLPASLSRHVTITPPLPLAPTIQTPAPIPNAGFTNDTTPVLDWNVPANWVTLPAGQSLTYELQLSTNAAFTALVAPTVTGLGITDHEWTETTLAATPGTLYYWRVRARTNLGLYGAYSPTYSFTLDTTAPNPPTTLTAPLDNAVSTSARPAFSWAIAPGANRYSLELSSTPNFLALEYGSPYPATLTSLALPISQPQGAAPLYWRVRAQDAAGNISVPSTSRTLRIDYVTAPVDNTVKALVGAAVSTPVAFSWTPVTGLTGAVYTVNVYSDSLLTTLQTTSNPIAAATWTSPALPIGQYWWTLTAAGMGTSSVRRLVVSPPLPGAPLAPFAPAALSITNNTTPTFNWGTPTLNPGNVLDYELQISTVSTFASQAAGSPYVVTTRPFAITTALPDTPGQVYYWRARAHTALNVYGPYSAALSFTLDTTPPNAPLTLTAPLDNAIVSASRPSFSWAAGVGANRYKFQIAVDSAFTNPTLIDVTTPTVSYAIPTVTTALAQGTYFWRVWSLDAAGNQSTSPSVVRTFRISYPLTPADNAVFIAAAPSHVTFTWAALGLTVANTLQIQVDNNSDFSSPERTSPLLAATALSYVTSLAGSTPTITPLPYGRYYWRLNVTGQANPSLVRSFVISPAVPPAPVLSLATPAANTSDTTPSFGWNTVSSAVGATVTGYEFQLSTVNTFVSLVGGASVSISGGSTTSFTWSPALPATPGQAYFARIRAVTNLGGLGAWSVARAFTLDTQAPLTGPTLIAPLNNASSILQKPTFQWSALAGAVQYDIHYAAQADLSAVTPIRVATLTHVPSTNLLFANYFWEVRGIDAAGNIGPWSTPRMVSIVSAPTAAPSLWNYTTSTPTLTWTPLAWALSYDIQVSRDSAFTMIVWSTTGLTANGDPSAVVGTVLANGTYYWRVRAIMPMPAPVNSKPAPYSPAYMITVEAP